MRNFLGTASNVTSTEKWLAALAAGQAFGGQILLASSVGNKSCTQLYNPAASGKTALVRTAVASPDVASAIVYSMYDTQLTTDLGVGVNLVDGGAAPVCHLRSQNPAATVGTAFHLVQLLAGTTYAPVVEWFAQLAAGQGLVVQSFINQVQVITSFMWLEQ